MYLRKVICFRWANSWKHIGTPATHQRWRYSCTEQGRHCLRWASNPGTALPIQLRHWKRIRAPAPHQSTGARSAQWRSAYCWRHCAPNLGPRVQRIVERNQLALKLLMFLPEDELLALLLLSCLLHCVAVVFMLLQPICKASICFCFSRRCLVESRSRRI